MFVLTPFACIGHVTSVLGWRPSSVRMSSERVLGHARLGKPRAGGRYFGWLDTIAESIDRCAEERGSDTFPAAFDPLQCNNMAGLVR